MLNCLPGTTIETDLGKNNARMIIGNVFSAGGLVLSQVSQLAGIEAHTVQNWVKRGFLSPPVAKKYSKEQFCRIITINMLKESLPINEVARLLSYVNGHLTDDGDDLIDDDELYLLFVSVISDIKHFSEKSALEAIDKVLSDYKESFSGAKERIRKTLLVMSIAYFSTLYSKKASIYMKSLDL